MRTPPLHRSSVLAVAFTLASVVASPGGAQQSAFPAYDAEWVGYDTGYGDQVRWPWAFAPGDLDGDGDVDYVAVQGASIPGLTVHDNLGNGSFADPVLHDTTALAFWDDVQDVALADLDQDGDLDAVAVNDGNSGNGAKLLRHLNQGDGTFAPYTDYASGPGPTGVALTDLDGDGWIDAVTANYGFIGQGNSIGLHTNDGSGGLAGFDEVVVGPSPRKVTAGDLDGDGDPDLGVALEDETLKILENLGGGAFDETAYPVFPSANAGTLHAAVAFGDMDGDNDLDAVYTSTKCGFQFLPGTGAIGVLYNDGSGALGAPLQLTTAPETQGGVDLALADWNGDGRLDVASAHDFDGEWELFESVGASGFAAYQLFSAAASAIAVDGSDLTGDGIPDVAILGRDSLELCVYKNRGDGDFARTPQWAFLSTLPGIFDPAVADGLDVADVDGDGDMDLGTAYYKIQGLDGGQAILLNDGSGALSSSSLYATPVGAANFAFANLNGDGAPDMLSTDVSSNGLRRRFNNGFGGFGPEEEFAGAGGPQDIAVFDVDGDGLDDVVEATSSFLFTKLNDGSGNFPAPGLSENLSTFVFVVAGGDLDGDGIGDVVTDSSFIGVESLLGNGDGTFGDPVGSTADWGIKGIVLADLDLDGTLDAATSAWSDDDHDHPTIEFLRGLGDGTFAEPVQYLGSHQIGTSSNAGDIVATDYDGDGDLDLATGNYWSLDVSFFEANGDGTFQPQRRYGTGGNAFGTVAADMDGDGFEDLAVGITIGPSIDFYPAAVVLLSNRGGLWKDLGSGLPGVSGVPSLDATPVLAGQPLTFTLSGAAPSSSGLCAVGFSPTFAPLFGGTVVPSLEIFLPLATDASGSGSSVASWPAGLPPGIPIYVQAGLLDAAAAQGVALSNALQGVQL